MDAGSADVHIGVAGWDYPDWRGPVYPLDAGSGLDRLAWIARFVDVIEVNSTFYRPVASRTAEGWIRRTASRPRFSFTAKAHRSWSHEIAGDLAAAVRSTLDGLEPLRDAGRLGALLVQFPQAFHATHAARDHLARLTELTGDWPLVAELRHVSWATDEARDAFARLGIGWCAVDQPRVGRSTIGTLPHVCGSIGYLRLHGRNAQNWFRPDAGRDARYDYRYARDELDDLARTARSMAARAETLFVVQNNHFRGQALLNALQFKALVGDGKPLAPAALVAAYPELARDVVADQGSLL